MKALKTGAKGLLVILIILFGSVSVYAGTTGKIRGVVRDASNNNPLPGANVIITKIWSGNTAHRSGYNLGAATSTNGEFIILHVHPGVYSVKAMMIGYEPMVLEKVVVNVDRTTRIIFRLKPTVLQIGKSLVVEAKRDPIQLDVSGTENYVTSKDYKDTPFANRVDDVIGLQAGVEGNIVQSEISIRGGETMEVGYVVDGMSMVDQKFNRPVIAINPEVVQEIKIMRNGFNAEYGEARSGIISIVTKTPGDRTTFSVDYQFDPPHRPHYGRSWYSRQSRWEWRLMDGPHAFEGDSLFLREGRTGIWKYWEGWNKYSQDLRNDNNPNNDLTPKEAYELWKWRHRPIKYGNLAGHNVNMSLSGRVPVMPIKTNYLAGFRYEFHPLNIPQGVTHYGDLVGSLKLVTTLSPNMKLTTDGILSRTRSVTENEPTSKWRDESLISYSGGGVDLYYPFAKPIITRYSGIGGIKLTHTVSSRLFYELSADYFRIKWNMQRPDSARAKDGRYFHGRLYYDPHSGWIPKEKGYDDNVSHYRMYGGAYTWDNSYNNRLQIKGNLTDQFNGWNEFKTGFELNYNVVDENRVHWHNEDSTQVFERRNHVTPYELSAYLQDKIEFKGMVANVGVRFNYYNMNSDRPNIDLVLLYKTDRDIYNAMKQFNDGYRGVRGAFPFFRPTPKIYISPRIGISHPLTENSKIYFNYGHFAQMPPTSGAVTTVLDGQRPRVQFMGNGKMGFEKIIAYEVGYDQNVRNLFQIHFSAFYKDYSDMAWGMVYAHSDQSLICEWADQRGYQEIRGLEVELRKISGKYLTGWFNYTITEKSKADLSVPGLSQIPIVTDDPTVGIHGILSGVPRPELSESVPHGKGVVTLSLPSDWGPKFKGIRFFGNMGISAELFYQGGNYVQHPRQSFRDAHPNVRFKEISRYWANFRFSKYLRLGNASFELYMDASNLLHTKYRYPPGGQAGEDYFDDLYKTGRLDKVGTDKVSDPLILRTESDDVYWAKLKTFIFGIRFHY